MPQTFGTRLRRHRQQQHIELASIAAETKIALPLLEGLEADSVAHWPSGIFRRAFIRAYAHAIGLEPDEVVREFLELHPDPVEVLTVEPAVASGANGGRPPTRLRCFLSKVYARITAPGAVEASAGRVQPFARAPINVDLLAAANLCEKLAQAAPSSNVTLLIREAVRILDAVGLIVWAWDARVAELRPALTEGYSASVLAQLPKVRRDTDNATAAAFRSARTCAVRAGETETAALAVPVMSPDGAVGVLTVELPSGSEQVVQVRAVITMFAAQLARLMPNLSVLAGLVEMGERGPVEFSEPHHDEIGSRVHTQIVHATHG